MSPGLGGLPGSSPRQYFVHSAPLLNSRLWTNDRASENERNCVGYLTNPPYRSIRRPCKRYEDYSESLDVVVLVRRTVPDPGWSRARLATLEGLDKNPSKFLRQLNHKGRVSISCWNHMVSYNRHTKVVWNDRKYDFPLTEGNVIIFDEALKSDQPPRLIGRASVELNFAYTVSIGQHDDKFHNE